MGVIMGILNEFQIQQAIKLLQAQEVIILPTDTIYGLSATVSLENEQKINALKASVPDKPLIVLVSNLNQAAEFIDLDSNVMQHLNTLEPTTVISKKLNGERTWAVRLIKRADLVQIINVVGPIFSTSVNRSGQKYLTTEAELSNFLKPDHCFFIGELKNQPSKILNLLDNSKKR
ncbi:L-threonylcarbamoyladenylate synthase [Spiroplasma clarkii]|nr:Sua5/YciO/YrdC/YwlC family protein [Spiroplasma clarkii]